MRIDQHPIIDDYHKGEIVEFSFDGRPMKGYEGEPIAAVFLLKFCLLKRVIVEE